MRSNDFNYKNKSVYQPIQRNIWPLVGDTPLIRLDEVVQSDNVEICGKAEWFNLVGTEETYRFLQFAGRRHGLLIGISSGVALLAAKALSERMQEGAVVVLLPDSGTKYLSLPFWEQT